MLKWVTNESPSQRRKRNSIQEGTSHSVEERTAENKAKDRRSVATPQQSKAGKPPEEAQEYHRHTQVTGRLPAKIEMLLNNHENVLPSAGVVFLQFADEVKRVHLPATLPSITAVQNLFISAYPDSVTKKDFRDGSKMVYIKDVASGTFYELERLEEVLNLSWLKIHDKLPVGNRIVLPEDTKTRTITHTGRTSKSTCNHHQPRPMSRYTSGVDEYDDGFGAGQWTDDQRNHFSGSLKRGSAVISRKKKKNEANNKVVTWNNSNAANELENESRTNDKTNNRNTMVEPASNICDPNLLQKSVETELESLNALLTSAFDTHDEEEVWKEENNDGKGGSKEYVNIKSPGRLDPRFLNYIESEARNAVFTRSNTLPKYYKPTIIVAAQEESRRRKNSGRSEENNEGEPSGTNGVKTRTTKVTDNAQHSTKEVSDVNKLGTNTRNGSQGGRDQETNHSPLFEFQNIETDEKGEPKLNTTNDLPKKRLGSSSADVLDDDVFEMTGDALTAVVESLLHATEKDTKAEADTTSNSEAFVRNVPLRNTFPKYYKPNIIIQSNKKDPNEASKMLVANTATDTKNTSTSVKMKMGRNPKKEVYKSQHQGSVNAQQQHQRHPDSKAGVSSVVFQLNPSKEANTSTAQDTLDLRECNSNKPEHRDDGPDRENSPTKPTEQLQKEAKRRSNIRESLVIKDLLERYGPKKAKKKEAKNGTKWEYPMGEELNGSQGVGLNESRNQTNASNEVSSKDRGFVEGGIIGGGIIGGGIIDPSVSQLMSQIADTERDDVASLQRNSRYLASDTPNNEPIDTAISTGNTSRTASDELAESAENRRDSANSCYLNERILPTQQDLDTSENTNTNDNSTKDTDQMYAKVSKTTTSKIKLNFSKNKNLREKEARANDRKKEAEESHYTTIKDLRMDPGDLSKSARSVQDDVNHLRRCLDDMRSAHQENARSFERDIQYRLSEFHDKASRLDVALRKKFDSANGNKVTFAGDAKNVQQKRYGLSREQREYANRISNSESRLTKLENEMDTFRTTVTIRNCMENPEILDELHGELTELTKGLADIKNRFHCIRDQLKHVISEELQVISAEERFLREEPQKLQDLVGRCKALSRTLFTLGELVNVQAELDGEVIGSDIADAGSSTSQSSSTKTTSASGDGVVTTSLHLPRQKRKK